ncbi:MAG: hypothetical protein ABII74_05150 [Elusimicrobiota bacterium]
MKKLILFLSLMFYALTIFAESRSVAISCKAIIKGSKDSRTITGSKYSLYTGIESEQVKNVTLEKLLPKIEKVAYGGSVIDVFIFFDYPPNTQTLKSIIGAIERNFSMQVIYMGNGRSNKLAEQIIQHYKL